MVLSHARIPGLGCPPARPSLRSRSHAKITGVTIRICTRLEIMPPTTGVASGCMISTPVRWSQKMGVSEAMVVATVMTLGRSRSRAPALTASVSSSRVSSRPRRRALGLPPPPPDR